MKVFHVIYGGMLNTPENDLSDEMLTLLDAKIGKRYRSHITDSLTTYVDNQADIDNLMNTLDDLQIPFSERFNHNAGVFTNVTFVLNNVDNRKEDVLSFIRSIDSYKGN